VDFLIIYYDKLPQMTMTDEEWIQLTQMREHIQSAGAVASFDTTYMGYYTYLLAKSLQGKGNAISYETTNVR
jgi:hypothetical protein